MTKDVELRIVGCHRACLPEKIGRVICRRREGEGKGRVGASLNGYSEKVG